MLETCPRTQKPESPCRRSRSWSPRARCSRAASYYAWQAWFGQDRDGREPGHGGGRARRSRGHRHRDRHAAAQGFRRRRHAGLRAAEEAARGQSAPSSRRDSCWPRSTPRSTRPRSTATARSCSTSGRSSPTGRRSSSSPQLQFTRQQNLTARTPPRPTRCRAPRRREQSALAQVDGDPGADRADRIHAARRRGQPRLHQDLRADGRHRRVADGEAGPDAERQPAGADHPAHRRSFDDDGVDPGVRGRRAEAARRHGRLLHHAGRRQPPALGKLRQILPTPTS